MSCLFRTRTLPRALSLLTALAALWLCLTATPAAHAGAYTYDTSARRTVNAGILLLDSTNEGGGKGDSNKDPYLFYVLNQRIDIRPFGWNIVNPLAPATVTQAIQARWNARAGANVYGLGQTVTPNMAAYWEVDLQRTAADDLSQFDVLYLGIDNKRQAQFSVTDTQKLLHFVDNGGILFIEYVGNDATLTPPIDTARPLFFGLQFYGTTTGNGGAAPGTVGSLPLLSAPYALSMYELNTLGDKGIGNYYIDDGGTPSGLLSNVIVNTNQSNKPVVAAGSLGAGGIVVSALGVANAINERIQTANNIEGPSGFNSGPYCGTNYMAAPTADLKFLSNILASVGTHPNAHQNSHNTGFTPNGLPSAARIWTTSGTAGNGGGNSPAVINGNFVYVTTGATLHAYDLYPAEYLTGGNSPDDGDVDLNQGKPYDQVWHADVGDNASAPTVAVDNSGAVVVFVEKADGTVAAYDGRTGGPPTNIPSPLPNSNGRGSYSGPAPAPTFYNGKVYAGGQDGSLYVYNINTQVDAKFNLDPSGNPFPVVAPPTVGTVLDAGVNDIVALVTTSNGMYSVFCGARGETLRGSGSNFDTKLKALPSARMDAPTSPSPLTWSVYTIPTPSDGYPSIVPPASVTPGAGTPNFTLASPITQALLGNYDVNFNASAAVSTSGPLTRTIVSLTSGPTTPGGNLSAPALDRYGNAYYTAGNSLFCVHDTATLPQIKWRFRLPTAPMLDADGTNYTSLVGYNFVGAPVVDEQGLVYVLASNGGSAVVLCFNGQVGVTADAPGAGTNIKISQLDPNNAAQNEFGQTAPYYINPGQFNINTDGLITFSNFAPNSGNGGAKTLNPTLNEPFPIQIQINVPNNQTPPPPFQVGLHTNLVYYSRTANNAPSSGLTKVGSSLFYTATNGHLIRVDADPATAGATPANKAVTDLPGTPNPMFHDTGDSGAGGGAVPSSANGVLVVNGANGVSAYANQVTTVVDNNRVLEMDSNGNAMWAVDSTQKTTVAGGDAPVYNGGSAPANPGGQYVTTTLELNRPSSVHELSPNDYLVADTGNNRCVRFDRGAKVIWELTRFYQDPAPTATAFLRPGEPDTLNQPTSVQIINAKDPATGNPVVRYLIADSGNFRVVEVSDFYDANSQPIPNRQHLLTWISHTHDIQARQYRYGSAAYYAVAYPDTSGTTATHYFVAALVTNKRIAPVPAANVTTGALAPANQDTNGGSIVLLNYDATNTSSTNGYIASATSTLQAGGQTVQIRNPRYLQPYSPNPPTNNSYGNFLLADDNGVFDLALTGFQFNVTWGFIQSRYQAMKTPLDAAGAALQALPSAGTVGQFDRSRIPFVPTCIQKLGDNDYLITNGFAQGEAGTTFGDYGNAIPPGFGGEVFEVNDGANPFGGYGGHTLSRPTNTAPLTQPTFAHRGQ